MRVRIQGVLDMIRISDCVFELLLKDGQRLRGVWTLPTVIHLGKFLNLPVVIEGDAVFRASGSLLRVDTVAIAPAVDADAFFSKVPIPPKGKHLHEKVRRPQRANAGAAAIYGKWPGDESEEELLASLETMRE